jgi:hypothetical protein
MTIASDVVYCGGCPEARTTLRGDKNTPGLPTLQRIIQVFWILSRHCSIQIFYWSNYVKRFVSEIIIWIRSRGGRDLNRNSSRGD